MSGKGSAPRPLSIPKDEYENRWDAIFNKNKSQESPETLKENLQKPIENT